MSSIHEYVFDIKFKVYEEGIDRILVFPMFDYPLIIPCDVILQDASGFLQSNLFDYVGKRDAEILGSQIVSYYN